MTEALKAFETETNKINGRIEELKAANRKDGELLQKLEADYEQAVNSFQGDKIDKLHGEISSLKQKMDNHSRQIEILESPNNPLRLQAKESYVKGLESERAAIRERADALHADAMKARENYLSAVWKALETNTEHVKVDRALLRANGAAGYGDHYLSSFAYKVEHGEVTSQGGKQ